MVFCYFHRYFLLLLLLHIWDETLFLCVRRKIHEGFVYCTKQFDSMQSTCSKTCFAAQVLIFLFGSHSRTVCVVCFHFSFFICCCCISHLSGLLSPPCHSKQSRTLPLQYSQCTAVAFNSKYISSFRSILYLRWHFCHAGKTIFNHFYDAFGTIHSKTDK